MPTLRTRFWVESALAELGAVLAALTLVLPDWIGNGRMP